MNKLAVKEAMQHADEAYDVINDDEFDEIFDKNTPDVDLNHLESEILIKEINEKITPSSKWKIQLSA